MFYAIANPDEYYAVTGAGIEDIAIRKSGLRLPLQKWARISLRPRDYTVSLQGMTIEKLPLEFQMVYTIGPDEKSKDALIKHSKLIARSDDRAKSMQQTTSEHVTGIVNGVIEGNTRVLVSVMTMEEIFSGREKFKKDVYLSIQNELNQFGVSHLLDLLCCQGD
jgi:flotillin